MNAHFEPMYTEMWTDCRTLEVTSSDGLRIVYDLPEQDFPEPPDELEDILDTACRRYEAFIGRCDGDFPIEEIEADRKKYSYLTTPFGGDVMDFDLFKCVEYMHLSYGVSKIFATSFAYRYFLIWWFAGGVTEDQEVINRNWEDILKFFEETKALLDELQKDKSSTQHINCF